MNKYLAIGIGSAALFFTVLWGGFYLGHQIPDDHWALFPMLFTGLVIGAASLFGAVFVVAFWITEE